MKTATVSTLSKAVLDMADFIASESGAGRCGLHCPAVSDGCTDSQQTCRDAWLRVFDVDPAAVSQEVPQ